MGIRNMGIRNMGIRNMGTRNLILRIKQHVPIFRIPIFRIPIFRVTLFIASTMFSIVALANPAQVSFSCTSWQGRHLLVEVLAADGTQSKLKVRAGINASDCQTQLAEFEKISSIDDERIISICGYGIEGPVGVWRLRSYSLTADARIDQIEEKALPQGTNFAACWELAAN